MRGAPRDKSCMEVGFSIWILILFLTLLVFFCTWDFVFCVLFRSRLLLRVVLCFYYDLGFVFFFFSSVLLPFLLRLRPAFLFSFFFFLCYLERCVLTFVCLVSLTFSSVGGLGLGFLLLVF